MVSKSKRKRTGRDVLSGQRSLDTLVFHVPPFAVRCWPGDLSLRLTAKPVESYDDLDAAPETQWLQWLVRGMGTVMQRGGGMGLAAPQVGVQQRVIVLADDDPVPDGHVSCFALVNPRIVETGKETDEDDEGCLSLPGVHVVVERATAVRVEHETVFGETLETDMYGRDARVVQHEIDHLDGKLILDYLEPADRRQAMLSIVAMQLRAQAGAGPGPGHPAAVTLGGGVREET